MSELKVLKVEKGYKKEATFNISITFKPDGKMYWHGEEWKSPVLVPEDHPDISDLIRRSPFILEDFKLEKPIIKKKEEA